MSKKFGFILIVIGGTYLLENFIDLPIDIPWNYVWPTLLILYGLSVLFGGKRYRRRRRR